MATYSSSVVSSGTQNTNPVILSSAGRAAIWLTSGTAYKIVVRDQNGVQQWVADNVMGLATTEQGSPQATTTVNFSATPTFSTIAQNQLFKITLTGNVTSSTLVMAAISAPAWVTFQITQDLAGGHTFAWPATTTGGATIAMTAGVTSAQTFLWNGTAAIAVGPAVTGNGPGVVAGMVTASVSSSPATSGQINLADADKMCWRNHANTADVCVAKDASDNLNFSNSITSIQVVNNTGTGTVLHSLATLNAGTATVAPLNAVSGILGVVTAGAGNSGSATIQQIGWADCNFDGATTANDYVVASSTTGGDCHDAGAAILPGIQTVGQVSSTNGTAGMYSVLLFNPGPTPFQLPNAATTGTTLYTLVKQTGNPATAVITTTTDLAGIVGIVIAGAGTTGSASIQQQGQALCVFDGATTANDYVVNSTTTAGNCHDAGVAPPNVPHSTEVLGQVLGTNATAGTYAVNLYGFAGPVLPTNACTSYASTASAGCTILPDGKYLEWIQGAADVADSSSKQPSLRSQTLTWPVAFPTACLAPWVTTKVQASSNNENFWYQIVGVPSTTSAAVQRQTVQDDAGIGGYWDGGTTTPTAYCVGN